MSACKLCREPKTWSGDDQKCAFLTGTFSANNWNCGTVNAIRYLMERGNGEWHANCWRTRFNDCSIGVLAIAESLIGELATAGEFVVATWYKDRGACDSMQIIVSDTTQALYLFEAEMILDAEAALQLHYAPRKATPDKGEG